MPEPSREAREAAEALFHHKHDIPYSEGNARQVARALDDFAEKWREEASRLRTDAPHYCALDHQPIRHADTEHERCPLCRAIDERDALRRRVAELEKADEDFVSIVGRTQEIANKARDERDDWKARAEAAEKALDSFIRDFEGDFVLHGEIVDNPEKLWSPLVDLYQEARRARGDS